MCCCQSTAGNNRISNSQKVFDVSVHKKMWNFSFLLPKYTTTILLKFTNFCKRICYGFLYCYHTYMKVKPHIAIYYSTEIDKIVDFLVYNSKNFYTPPKKQKKTFSAQKTTSVLILIRKTGSW